MSDIEAFKKVLADHEKRIKKLESTSKAAQQAENNEAKKGIPALLVELKNEGFFKQPKFLNDVKEKLGQDGYHYSTTSLSGPLQEAVQRRLLGRLKKEGQWAYVNR